MYTFNGSYGNTLTWMFITEVAVQWDTKAPTKVRILKRSFLKEIATMIHINICCLKTTYTIKKELKTVGNETLREITINFKRT